MGLFGSAQDKVKLDDVFSPNDIKVIVSVLGLNINLWQAKGWADKDRKILKKISEGKPLSKEELNSITIDFATMIKHNGEIATLDDDGIHLALRIVNKLKRLILPQAKTKGMKCKGCSVRYYHFLPPTEHDFSIKLVYVCDNCGNADCCSYQNKCKNCGNNDWGKTLRQEVMFYYK